MSMIVNGWIHVGYICMAAPDSLEQVPTCALVHHIMWPMLRWKSVRISLEEMGKVGAIRVGVNWLCVVVVWVRL